MYKVSKVIVLPPSLISPTILNLIFPLTKCQGSPPRHKDVEIFKMSVFRMRTDYENSISLSFSLSRSIQIEFHFDRSVIFFLWSQFGPFKVKRRETLKT